MVSSVLPALLFVLFIAQTALLPCCHACIGFGGCAYGYHNCGAAAYAGYFSPCYGTYCRKMLLKGSRVLALNDTAEGGGGETFTREHSAQRGAEEKWPWPKEGQRLAPKQQQQQGDEEARDDFVELEVSPDVLFRECCHSWSLPPHCLPKCSYENYTAETLRAMFFRSDECPIESASIIHFCASQNQDHRECCRRNGIVGTKAGEKCLVFCEQMPSNETRLDLSYVPCFERFAEMKKCFQEQALRSIDYLEAELAEARLRESLRQSTPVDDGFGGGGADEEDRAEAESTFAIARPPIIFVNDVSPKHPHIEDDYVPPEVEQGHREEAEAKEKRRVEEQRDREEEERWMREGLADGNNRVNQKK